MKDIMWNGLRLAGMYLLGGGALMLLCDASQKGWL